MTSSYGNVIGTPQDEIPDISDTNYLATEADMTAAVNEQIDENIKDTKEFYNDMMKIEENRYKTRDRRLEAIYNITGKLAELYPTEAERLEKKLNDYKLAQDRKNRNELVNRTDNETSYNGLKLAEFIGNNEDTRIPEVQEILKQLNFDLDEDVDLKTFLAKYNDEEFIGSIYSSALQQLGHDALTNVQEGVDMRKFVQQLIRNKIHVEAIKRGFDIESGRYEKNLLKIVQPSIDNIARRYGYALTTQINTNLKAEQKEILDDKIRVSATSINISPENGQDLTTFTDKNSIIKQISVAPTYGFNGDMSKANDYYFTKIAELLDNNKITVAQANAVLEDLPYSDFATQTDFRNVRDYLASLDPESEFFLKVSNRVKAVDDAIERKFNTQNSEEKKIHKKLQRPYEKEVTALYELAAKNNRKVNAAEAFKIIQGYYGDPNLWVPNHPIKGIKPKFITDLETSIDYLGNKDVDIQLKNAALVNGFDGAILKEVALYKKKKVGGLDAKDYFLATTLKDELKASLIRSENPGGKSDFEIHVDNGNDPKLFVQSKLDDIILKLNNGDYDATLVVNSSKLAYQKQDLIKLHKDSQGSTVDSNTVYDGEAPWLEKTLLHIRSGGKLHKEVIQWWSEFKVKDNDGSLMRPRELMFRRLNALGVFENDPIKGFFVDPRRQFMTSEEMQFEDTSGLVGTMNLMTKTSEITGEPMSKSILDTFALPEAEEGATDSKFTGTGYDYFKGNKTGLDARIENFGYTIMANITKAGEAFGIPEDARVQLSDLRVYDPSDTSNLPRSIYAMAKKNPEAVFGRYGITGKQLVELFDQPAFKAFLEQNPGQAYDANFQDFLAFESIRFQLNKRNSIRGMKIEEGQLQVTDMTVFSPTEIEAMKEIFPRLANYKFSQLNMLAKPIADIILTDLEKAQKKDAEEGGNENVKAFKEQQKQKKIEKRRKRQRLDFSE
jgi:hypothetical protein|tara:strand:+ start:1486 stop:4344 length:2859 start_codon:yes stop_codon:yes gene_type:complete